jgi:hypothetical protein
MASNQIAGVGSARHVQTFTSTGTFTPPLGVNQVYVSIEGATGGCGGIGAHSTRYGNVPGGAGGNGGAGAIVGAWVQVLPGVAYTVTIGAGGSTGGDGRLNVGTGGQGSTGGTTGFDGVLTVSGGTGGYGSGPYSGNGSAGSTGALAYARTSLTTLSPSSSATPRVGTVTTSGSTVPGPVGAASFGQPGGTSGTVHIYLY